MFKLISFRSDGAFWPLAERSDLDARAAFPDRRPAGRAPARVAAHPARSWRRGVPCSARSLDERMLRDIGIERDQIWLRHPAGREALACGPTVAGAADLSAFASVRIATRPPRCDEVTAGSLF